MGKVTKKIETIKNQIMELSLYKKASLVIIILWLLVVSLIFMIGKPDKVETNKGIMTGISQVAKS